MPIVPIRGVGAAGIIKDRSNYDLDPSMWSDGRNVRFDKAAVSNFSVFKNMYPEAELSEDPDEAPVGVIRFIATDNIDKPILVNAQFQMLSLTLAGATITDVGPGGTYTTSDQQVTSCHLGGLTYVNREDSIPVMRGAADATFTELANWDPLDTCFSLRAFKDFLIAINVTKDGQNYPQMVKWSNATEFGAEPVDWDTADPGSLAGETILNDSLDSLVDGQPLADAFILYTGSSAYVMEYIGEPFVFRFRGLFSDDGAIARNCVAEVDNKHFVFGTRDFYVHDGVTKQSLTSSQEGFSRIREYVFSALDFDKAHRCFVFHDPNTSEVHFCFPCTVDEIMWPGVANCNMSAVYNYRADTWTFVDLPNVVGGTSSAVEPADTWAELPDWSEIVNPWRSFGAGGGRLAVMYSAGNLTGSFEVPPYCLVLDDPKEGHSNQPVLPEVNGTPYVERTGIDMDELGAEIRARKMLRSVYPQVTTDATTGGLTIQLGRQVVAGSPLLWDTPREFDPKVDYKHDTRNTGRYLAMRFTFPPSNWSELSGYDLDIVQISKR